MASIARRVFIFAFAVLLPSAVMAQVQAPAAAATPAPAPVAGFQDGFFIQTDGGDNRLTLGVIVQADGRFSVDEPTPIVNTFTIRKARPIIGGRLARYFDFRLMPEFGNGAATILDAHFDLRFSPKLRVRTGKDKTPVAYEMLIGDAFLPLPERSLAAGLVPNRDVGVQLQGDLSPKLYYAAGVFNGIPDGAGSTTDVDTNNGKDIAGRVVLQPFRAATNNNRALSGLGLQVGGSTGKHVGTLPAFRTSVGQTYFSYATGAAAGGRHSRVATALFYSYRSFGGFAEYIRSTQEVTRLSATRGFTNEGWVVTASYLLTGEAAGQGYTRPRRPFNPPEHTWGALQVAARYSTVDVDDRIFSRGFAGPGAADIAKQFSVGLNWYPVPYVKYYATYERTEFEGGVAPARPVENVFLLRAQLGI